MPTLSRILAVAATAAVTLTVAPPASAEPSGDPKPGQLVPVAGFDKWGGYSGDGGDARQARIGDDPDVAVAQNGSVYLSDMYSGVLRVVNPEGIINTVPITSDPERLVDDPIGVAITGTGVLYVATRSTVRRMNADGTFTVVAGGGEDEAGDGGPATAAELSVSGLAVADDGTLYLTERFNHRVRRVDPGGTITTLAAGLGADLDGPENVAVGPDGTVYVTVADRRGVQKIGADGTVSAVLADDTPPGFAGDGGPVAEARFGSAGGIATDRDGNLYVADSANGNVRVIGTDGKIDTVGPSPGQITDVAVGPDGDLYLTMGSQVFRLVRNGAPAPAERVRPGAARWTDQDPGTILPVAGSGREMTDVERLGGEARHLAVGLDGTVYYTTFVVDKVFAIRPDGTHTEHVKSGLHSPEALAVDHDGNLYVAEGVDYRIRKVDRAGTITTIAGTGETVRDATGEAPVGDGGPATAAPVYPMALAAGPDGSVYVADHQGRGRIRKIDPSGVITTVVGGGKRSIDDGVPATEVGLAGAPESLTVDATGNVYFTAGDHNGARVFLVTPGGAIVAVAGAADTGEGFAGDGGPASAARLNHPRDPAIGPDGTRYFADSYNNRIRAVRADGVITTVAGTGPRTDGGDGGPATKATLQEPERVGADEAGNVYFTTAEGATIRKIDTKGRITTHARLGLVLGGDARKTVVDSPTAVAVDPAGTVYAAGETPVLAVAPGGAAREVTDLELVDTLAAGPDGSVYLSHQDRVERIHPDGTMVTVAGGGAIGAHEDHPPDPAGRRATSSVLDPADLATGPSGDLYLTAGTRVFRLDRDGTLKSIVDIKKAGGFKPAEYRRIALAVGRDGVLYVADSGSNRVYTVDKSGAVHPFAGNGESSNRDDRGDGDNAVEAPVSRPDDLAVDADGTVYIATRHGIRRVTPDGDIDTVVEPVGKYGDESPGALALDAHGNLYFTLTDLNQVRVVVRPGELSPPFPWSVVWLGVAVVAVVGAAVYGAVRLRGPRPTP